MDASKPNATGKCLTSFYREASSDSDKGVK